MKTFFQFQNISVFAASTRHSRLLIETKTSCERVNVDEILASAKRSSGPIFLFSKNIQLNCHMEEDSSLKNKVIRAFEASEMDFPYYTLSISFSILTKIL